MKSLKNLKNLKKVVLISAISICVLGVSGIAAYIHAGIGKEVISDKSYCCEKMHEKGMHRKCMHREEGERNADCKKARKRPMDELVASNTITQAQADAIRNSMKSAMESNKLLKDTLVSLVSSNTITQDQADAVLKTAQDHHGKRGEKVNHDKFPS